MLSLRKIINVGSRSVSLLARQPLSRPLGWPALAVARLSTSAPLPASIKSLSESFMNGTSAVYVEEMYSAWKKDPASVHKSWDVFFQNAEAGIPPGSAFMTPPTLGGSAASVPVPPTSKVAAVCSVYMQFQLCIFMF